MRVVVRAAVLTGFTCALALTAAQVLSGSWAAWALVAGVVSWALLTVVLAVTAEPYRPPPRPPAQTAEPPRALPWDDQPIALPTGRLDVHVWHHAPLEPVRHRLTVQPPPGYRLPPRVIDGVIDGALDRGAPRLPREIERGRYEDE